MFMSYQITVSAADFQCNIDAQMWASLVEACGSTLNQRNLSAVRKAVYWRVHCTKDVLVELNTLDLLPTRLFFSAAQHKVSICTGSG